jgi:hypothetical protein
LRLLASSFFDDFPNAVRVKYFVVCGATLCTPKPGIKTACYFVGSFRGAGFVREPGTHEHGPCEKGFVGRCSWFPGPAHRPSRNDDLAIEMTTLFASIFRAGGPRR